MEQHEFYQQHELPDNIEKERMWQQITTRLPGRSSPGIAVIHWKSFLIGAAAALILTFAGIGAFAVVNGLFGPRTSSLDEAYSEAMNRLMDTVPPVSQTASDPGGQVLESRIRGIEDLDAMILEMRNDILLNGNSDMKNRQLRSLYAMKMDMVKELVLEGAISL